MEHSQSLPGKLRVRISLLFCRNLPVSAGGHPPRRREGRDSSATNREAVAPEEQHQGTPCAATGQARASTIGSRLTFFMIS